MTVGNRVPYVKNTFLCLDEGPAQKASALRSISVSPKGSCDAFARQMHALFYRPTPVRERSSRTKEIILPEKKKKVCLEEPKKIEFLTLPPSGTQEKSTKKNRESGEETGSTDVGESSPSSNPSPDRFAGLDDEELVRQLPRDEAGKPLSIGSIGHDEGTCRPCVFAYNENKKCENGLRCPFCHFWHPPKKRVRLCKKKRLELKRQQEEEHQQEFDAELE